MAHTSGSSKKIHIIILGRLPQSWSKRFWPPLVMALYIIYSVIELWTPLYPFTFSHLRAISVEKDLFYFYYYYAPHLFLRKNVVSPVPSCIISLHKSVYLFVKIVCRYTLNIGSRMELAVVRRHLSNFRFRVYNRREWAESIGDNHTGILRINRALTLNIIIFQSSGGGEGTSTTVIIIICRSHTTQWRTSY